MPSRKVISIFIISIALVVAIVIAKPPKIVRQVSKTIEGSLSSGPEIKIANNPNWEKDITTLGPIETPKPTDSQNLTDEFARSFMANYLSLKQSGNLDSTNAKNLLDKSLQFIEKNDAKTYTLKDIVVSNDTSKTAITKYGNEFGLAVKQSGVGKHTQEEEFLMIIKMLQSEIEVISPEIANRSKAYGNLVNLMLKITVPSSFVKDHLDLVNSTEKLRDAMLKISLGLTDPIAVSQGLVVYLEQYDKAMNIYATIAMNILRTGANYKQGENGYYLYFGI